MPPPSELERKPEVRAPSPSWPLFDGRRDGGPHGVCGRPLLFLHGDGIVRRQLGEVGVSRGWRKKPGLWVLRFKLLCTLGSTAKSEGIYFCVCLLLFATMLTIVVRLMCAPRTSQGFPRPLGLPMRQTRWWWKPPDPSCGPTLLHHDGGDGQKEQRAHEEVFALALGGRPQPSTSS